MSSLTVSLAIVAIALIVASSIALIFFQNQLNIEKEIKEEIQLINALQDIIYAREKTINYIFPNASVKLSRVLIQGETALLIERAIDYVQIGKCRELFKLTPWIEEDLSKECVRVWFMNITRFTIQEVKHKLGNIITVYALPKGCSFMGKIQVNTYAVRVNSLSKTVQIYVISDKNYEKYNLTDVDHVIVRVILICNSS